jgi:tRNA(Ile)-lysidine synthase
MTNFRSRITWPPPGRYVVAVSGGSDSAALLDLLATHPKASQWELVPAHFNHGWPGDDAYEQTARAAVERYGLVPEVGRGKVKRTEDAARVARYAWLRQVMGERQALAIVTAHQRDDVEETILLNLLRGTGRQGLAPFAHTPDVLRPLTAVRKAELKAYARKRELAWCHDTYNDDLKFRRNAVRHQLIPELERARPDFHTELASVSAEAAKLNQQIDAELAKLFAVDGQRATVPISRLRQLDTAVAAELLLAMAAAVRPGAELQRRTVEQLAVDLKTGRLRRRRGLGSSLFAEAARGTVTMVFTP